MKVEKLVVALSIVLFSCKKDASFKPIVYPSSYYRSGLIKTSDLRIFSNSGEIKDRSLIDRFLGVDSFFYVYLSDQIKNSQGLMDSIRFVDEQHAIVNDGYAHRSCTIDHENEALILTRTDTSQSTCSGDQFTRTMTYYVGEIKPVVYSEYLVSSTRGYYVFGYTSTGKYVLQESNGQLVAPEIFFVYHTTNYYQGNTNNILQDDFFKNMAEGDTASIMGYQLLYEKQ